LGKYWPRSNFTVDSTKNYFLIFMRKNQLRHCTTKKIVISLELLIEAIKMKKNNQQVSLHTSQLGYHWRILLRRKRERERAFFASKRITSPEIRARARYTHSHTLYFWGLLWVFFFFRALQGGLKTSVVKNLSFSFGRSRSCRCWGCSIVVQNTGLLKYPHLKGVEIRNVCVCVWERERERESCEEEISWYYLLLLFLPPSNHKYISFYCFWSFSSNPKFK